ncbi:lytic murein transglycosylase, partial [Mesorhizobium sp. M1E.F.Ca.ET.041.01.1.1]
MSGRTEGGATERGFSKFSLAFLLLAIFSLIFTTPSRAAPIDDQFQAWLQTDLWPEAKAKG